MVFMHVFLYGSVEFEYDALALSSETNMNNTESSQH